MGKKKKSVSVGSAEYFLNVGFVLRDVVRIDEDVVQICDDYNINHVHENVIHEYLKAAGALVSPSGTRWYMYQRLILV